MTQFNVFGSLRVHVGDIPLRLVVRKQRLLLAILLRQANRPIPTHVLIDALWEGSPPQTAPTNLRVYVYQLRAALGDAKRITSEQRAYALHVAPGEYDADAFVYHADAGRAAMREHCYERAVTHLTKALRLCKEPGPAFGDLAYHPAIREETARLEEMRLRANDDRIVAGFALGWHADLTPDLRALVVRYPLNERFRGHLMMALHRSGRTAEALREYRDGRETLVDRLGIEPCAELRRLEAAILNADDNVQSVRDMERRENAVTLTRGTSS